MTAKRLRQVTIVAPWQACDALENFLCETGALGVSVEQNNPQETAEIVRAYFPENKSPERMEARLIEYVNAIKGFFPTCIGWHVSTRLLDDEVWQERWKQFFRPIRVTSRLVIKPTWEAYLPKGGEIILNIDPGMAFGTGLHATTRLCLESVEQEIDRRDRGKDGCRSGAVSVLDVGTGSGVLAIAAALLGAQPVFGIDKDHTAVQIARENVQRNHVEEIVDVSSARLEAIDQPFDLVVANIDLMTLTQLKKPLADHVRGRGGLILSGILAEQSESLAEPFWSQGLRLTGEKNQEGWSCVLFEKAR
jgi:ribosomal protein L11 methyltransferase